MGSNKKPHLTDVCWSFPAARPNTPTSPATTIASDDAISDQEFKATASVDRFFIALEKMIAARLHDNSSCADETVKSNTKMTTPSRASTLAFKRVEEA